MSVFAVYESSTGNVVGAVKAIGTPLPAADALVGAALPVRLSLKSGEVVTLSLAGRELAVHEADDQPAVFVEPLAYGVTRVTGQPVKPALAKLAELPAPAFDGAGLLVTVPEKTSEPLAVFALVSEGGDTLPLRGTIKEGADRVSLPVTVSAGAHAVLVLVAGRAGRLEEVGK
ncbi:hypothetical protein H4696_000406 [Amycolatopsis lexingtonensis]|uniref:SAF domain-containing protein n=1 Tax=Amycolatopsis lexingtonensis TaxID=218822 RepID=A0ABR9HQU5_9PSEU|nr:hypothetical protein [Amycolatopsis lexingtonensis]MBE1493306.1 hypothetical protein [Amycolatopsis lexingtonensis]